MSINCTISTRPIKTIGPLKTISGNDPVYQGVCQSVKKSGLLFPITISRNHFLLDGHKVCKAFEALGFDSIAVIQLDMETNLEKAWELHFLLNGKTMSSNTAKSINIKCTLDCNIYSDCGCSFRHLDQMTKPFSRLIMARMLRMKLDEMPFALRMEIHAILSGVWR